MALKLMPRRWKCCVGPVLAAALALPAAAPAQLPIDGPDLGGRPLTGADLPVINGLPSGTDTAGALRDLTERYQQKMDRLVSRHRRELAVDDRGAAVVRRQVLAISPTSRGLALARAEGFVVVREERLDDIGIVLVTLAPPPRQDIRQAVKRLRRADPDGQYEFNHLYAEAGSGQTVAASPFVASAGGQAGGVRVGLLDTGVEAGHAALAGTKVEQRGFAPGGIVPAAHGTATASLILRSGGSRTGGLLVADVYGSGPTGGSADAVLRGLSWLSSNGARVINVSLVGPANGALRLAIRNLSMKGVVVVAAVGNDGPAAAPLYPASWPEVVAVTAVDGRDRVLLEAGRATHVDFAAPGADITAARKGGGLAPVRGTSFAAPIVSGILARLMADRDGPAAIAALRRDARDLGAKGPDGVYGHGLIGTEYRAAPASR